MIEYNGEQFIIKLDYFSKEQIQEGLLALMKYVYYQQENLSFDWEQQRGYYILIEILLATLNEKESQNSRNKKQ